ncbi:outer membrane beta-barrel family protein, partial [bacterium]|nr:outer membrane beta-barrel family protein [bacterium]
DSTFSFKDWDIYPTLHSSYQFGGGQQFMASYSRRIKRVRGWYLEPFKTWMDAYNVRQGNPNLKPEYIDSYEAGYQKSIGKSLLSFETYYRVTHNKVERVRTVYDKDVFLQTFANVGKDYALGTELMISISPYKWWNLNIMGNIYDYRVKGELYDEPFNEGSFNWSTRVNNTFRLGKSTRIQLNGNYSSPTVSAQGKNGGRFFTNLAVRQDFWNRKLSATLQLRDILGTAVHEFTSEGPGFYSYNKFSRQPRMLSFTLTYNFNNYKVERDRRQDENGMEFDDEGGEFE